MLSMIVSKWIIIGRILLSVLTARRKLKRSKWWTLSIRLLQLHAVCLRREASVVGILNWVSIICLLRRHYKKCSFDSDAYKCRRTAICCINQQTGFVKVAYAFYFGHKTSRDDRNINTNINNAILKANWKAKLEYAYRYSDTSVSIFLSEISYVIRIKFSFYLGVL